MYGFSSSYKDKFESIQNICVFAVVVNREADDQSDSHASIILRFSADQVNKENLHMTEAVGGQEDFNPKNSEAAGKHGRKHDYINGIEASQWRHIICKTW